MPKLDKEHDEDNGGGEKLQGRDSLHSGSCERVCAKRRRRTPNNASEGRKRGVGSSVA